MAGITATRCLNPACRCGKVLVSVTDDDGKLLLTLLLPRPAAQTFLAELTTATEGRAPQPADRLHAIRCEGTA